MSYSIKPAHVVALFAVVGFVGYSAWLKNSTPTVAPLAVYPVRTASAAGVEVTVQPDLQSDAWTFEMYLNTHSVELTDDLAAAAVLRTAGREIRPLRWEGDPPGGHHRGGRLVFRPAPLDDSFTLVLENVAGVDARIFEWVNK